MSNEAIQAAADLMRRIAEMERQGQTEADGYQDLADGLRTRLQTLPAAQIASLVRRSPDLEEDEAYWTAIHALGERGDAETFAICKTWAAASEALTREAAADVLGRLGAEEGYPFAAETASILRPLLQDSDADVVASAVMAAGQLGLLAPDQLVAFAGHASNEVRFAAVHGLMGRDDEVSANALVKLTTDEDRDVRNWAAFALGQGTDGDTPAIRDALLALLAEDDAEIRGEALIGLARRGDPRVLAPLKKELSGEFQGAWCIEAAGALSDASLVPLLEKLRDRMSPEDLDAFGDEIEDAIEACSEE